MREPRPSERPEPPPRALSTPVLPSDRTAGDASAGAGRSRATRALPVEPRLEDDGGRGAVDALAGRSVVDPLLTQSAPRLSCRKPLVVELDAQAGPLAELASKAPGASGRRAFFSAERARQADHEQLELLGRSQRRQRVDGPEGIPAVQMVARVRHQAELVRYRNTDAHLADIDARGSHAGCG